MKFTLTFKTPDILDTMPNELLEDENQVTRAYDLVNQYIKWSEYITVEFDTEKQTAVVLKR